jgi:hypothetical protein
MRARPFAAMDALTLLLIGFGATLMAGAIAGIVVLVTEASPVPPSSAIEPPPDQVPTHLSSDAPGGTAALARVGDHVDVLGYFAGQPVGQDHFTRLLIADVAVIAIVEDNGHPTLTLGLPQASVVVLREAEALGARPFVVLRSNSGPVDYPSALNDSELAGRLSAAPDIQVAVRAP